MNENMVFRLIAQHTRPTYNNVVYNMEQNYIDDQVRDCRNSIANTLGVLQLTLNFRYYK